MTSRLDFQILRLPFRTPLHEMAEFPTATPSIFYIVYQRTIKDKLRVEGKFSFEKYQQSRLNISPLTLLTSPDIVCSTTVLLEKQNKE